MSLTIKLPMPVPYRVLKMSLSSVEDQTDDEAELQYVPMSQQQCTFNITRISRSGHFKSVRTFRYAWKVLFVQDISRSWKHRAHSKVIPPFSLMLNAFRLISYLPIAVHDKIMVATCRSSNYQQATKYNFIITSYYLQSKAILHIWNKKYLIVQWKHYRC